MKISSISSSPLTHPPVPFTSIFRSHNTNYSLYVTPVHADGLFWLFRKMERLRQEACRRYKLCRCPFGGTNLSRNVQVLDCVSRPLNRGVDGTHGETDQR